MWTVPKAFTVKNLLRYKISLTPRETCLKLHEIEWQDNLCTNPPLRVSSQLLFFPLEKVATSLFSMYSFAQIPQIPSQLQSSGRSIQSMLTGHADSSWQDCLSCQTLGCSKLSSCFMAGGPLPCVHSTGYQTAEYKLSMMSKLFLRR